MPNAPNTPEINCAAELAAERARHAQTAAELVAMQARVSALELQLRATPSSVQRQNTQLLALVQTLRLGLVLVSPEGQIQFVSQYFWELFGLPPVLPREGEESIAPSDFLMAHLFHDPDAFRARAWEMHREGKTVLQEEFVLADGRVLELDYLVLDTVQAGRLVCYRDVTERHQREAQVRTLAYYMPQHTPSPILRLAATGEVVYANPAAAPLLPELAAQGVLPTLVQAALQATSEDYQQELTVAGQYYVGSAVAVPGQPYATLYLRNITARRQAMQQLAEQRGFYEAILNVLPVEVVVWDEQHRSVFINPAALPDPERRQQALGLLPDAYFMLYDQVPPPPAVSQQRRRQFGVAFSTRSNGVFEEILTDPQRQERLIMRYLHSVCHPDGTLRMAVSLGIDITARLLTERKQEQAKVEVMLSTQQNFIQQIMDTLPNALYLVNADDSIGFTNKAFRDAATITQHAQGRRTNPVVEEVEEEMRQVALFNQQVRATRQAETRELTFTTIAGEKLYYQVYKRLLKQTDGQMGVFTITTDVTALRKASQALERREKQYHDLVYYSQALICTHDLEGKLLSVNPAIERLMGRPAAQLVGHHLRGVLPPEQHAALQAYLSSGEASLPQPRVVVIRTTAGERRYLQYYTYRVTEESYPPYVVASAYDVTPGYLAQRALRQAKQQAEENAQAKETFLSSMSHEIRTPLNGVLGMAALLQKTDLTAAQQEYLRTMQLAGRHLLALVNDVLDMAKITTQPLQLENVPFDLALVLQGAGQTVAALAEQKGLVLTIEPLATATARVVGDAYRLHQVLLNLLGNAIKFTEQGRVRLGTEVLHDTPTELALRFWVADTGIGMTAEEQAHIFEAFAQANTETSRRYGGTGLGLAISQQLVTQMGGTLLLSSAPGEGTTFSFQLVLPRADEAGAAPAPAPPSVSYEALRGRRVLLAEDNLVNQQIAIIVLENLGVTVTAESNGLDALAQLRAQHFDAALLDIRMPGLSGVEVTTAIRQHPDARQANVPIIALTANAFEAERAAYLAAGMNACLTKPYEEAALYQLLLDLTDKGNTGPTALGGLTS